MPNALVKLTTPITAHRVHHHLEFREPRWAEVMDIGDPYTWTPKPGEPQFVVPTPIPERVKAYAERLIADGDKPGNPVLLNQLGVIDSRAVQGAILDFFLSVDPRVLAGSTPSPTTVSSSADGAPTPSDG